MHNKTEGGSGLLVLILTFGVFSILNTEMGVIGMLPLIADTFQVSVPQAGWTVTVFALVIAGCGPITPMLFSRFDRKTVMLSALGVFIISNAVSMFTESFAVLLVSRAVPAIFHPVYGSMAFTVAATSVAKEDAPKAVAKVFIGVSAGMVLGVPAASFIASETSYAMAMFFFAAVNVTRSALENAASVAEMVLTTESLVADLPEPPAAPAAAGGDMGGMGGMY